MSSNNIIECTQLIANTSPSEYTGKALDYTVVKGRIIALTGPDNSGKNDWLKTLAGLYYPVSGTISFFDRALLDFNLKEQGLLRKKLAYITSELSLLSSLNGLANVMLPASYHQIDTPEQIKDKALELISELGINDGMEQLPADMHKEQCFGFMLARALMLDPAILFLENPFFLLNVIAAEKFKQFLWRKVKHDNMTIFVSTQDFHFIRQYADNILFAGLENMLAFNSADDFFNCKDRQVLKFTGKMNTS